MSKELIVSTTRHETRVAVIEDDQVAEIFYQREKEYSLAGSIHKGRVTRVLPGMQSAFVDIGLERDAFLYVSDFFEDNEEYDKVVSGVEEKVLRLERASKDPSAPEVITPDPLLPVASATSTSSVISASSDEPPAIAPPSPPVSAVERPPGNRGERPDRGDRGDDRHRGGRGRRRGRRGPGGNSGGGLPESKYFSPRPRPEYNESPAAPPSSTEDLIVLPGESLAKYGAGESRQIDVEESEPRNAQLGAISSGEDEPEALASDAIVEELSVDELSSEPEPAHFPAFAEEPPQSSAPEDELMPSPGDGVHAPASEAAAALELDDEILAIDEQEGEVGIALDEFPGEEAVSEASASTPDEEEGPEPARIPTSLTATLREQNQRYQHRVSRRMRRKGRGGAPGEEHPLNGNREGAPSDERAQPREDLRQDARPERQPRESREARDRDESPRTPLPSIADLLREGQEIVVQIAKEPLGQKGARITSHVALPGRFLVYMPSVDHIGVSRKIPSEEERLRLKRILQTNRTGIPGGFIVRTAGEGRSEEELRADMMFLYNLWSDMRQKVEKRPAPQLMHHDLDVVQRILRDQLTSAFKTVWVDNELIYESVLSFVQRFQPALVGRVKLYTRPAPIFDEFGITAELEKALRPKVWLKSGGYIVINQTEALVAIDINTGKYIGKSNRLEDTIVKTNTDAIKEIVRQIRLRDLGGIIVVDFIDMDERKNRQRVMLALEEAMRVDRAPYKILQFNDFGLVAITRKRVKQSLERTLCTPCSYCEGAGYVKSVPTVITEILTEAQKMSKLVDASDVMLRVHPEVAKVLKSNTNDYLQEIEETIGKTVMVKSDPLLHQTKFDLA